MWLHAFFSMNCTSIFCYPHCPKNYLNLLIKNRACYGTFGAFATVRSRFYPSSDGVAFMRRFWLILGQCILHVTSFFRKWRNRKPKRLQQCTLYKSGSFCALLNCFSASFLVAIQTVNIIKVFTIFEISGGEKTESKLFLYHSHHCAYKLNLYLKKFTTCRTR